jgi:dolichol-phosphate mannosyltransferase
LITVSRATVSLPYRHSVDCPYLWIVLPAFNEGMALVELVKQFAGAVQNYAYQIIVVDDGSSDNSMELLGAAQIDHTDIIRHGLNKGLGEAVKTGFIIALERACPQDIIIVMDSDGTHLPFLINRMAQIIREGHDVAIASRYRYGSRVRGLNLFRQLLSHGASWVFRAFKPIPHIRDYTCGFRAYRAEILKQAFDHYRGHFITESGFACMAEILIKLHKLGALCCEVPMVLRYDYKVSTSKIRILKTIARSLRLACQDIFPLGRAKEISS